MNNSGNSTHKPRAIDPANFRAQATGIGQTLGASRRTGAERAMEVAQHMPPAQRAAVPAAEGYPRARYEGVPEGEDLGHADDVRILPVMQPTLR